MTTRIPETPLPMRKAPRQARSRATIEAVLDAAAQVLGERGLAGITTNNVAARAGVSIGSLYQYFPNKAVLMNAVKARHLEEVLGVLDAASDVALKPAEKVARLVDGMIAIHSRYPASHAVMLEGGAADQIREPSFMAQYQQRYMRFVASACNAPHVDDLDSVAQVLASTVSGVIHDAARQNRLASTSLRNALVRLVKAGLPGACCGGLHGAME